VVGSENGTFSKRQTHCRRWINKVIIVWYRPFFFTFFTNWKSILVFRTQMWKRRNKNKRFSHNCFTIFRVLLFWFCHFLKKKRWLFEQIETVNASFLLQGHLVGTCQL
jgi:hypothetical protein